MKAQYLLAGLILVANSAWSQTCVSNQPLFQEAEQLVDLEDGTILDVKTNLLWSKCTLGQSYLPDSNSCTNDGATSYLTWQDALKATEDPALTTIGTVTGFRLPNIKELTSIVNYQCVFPAIDVTYFPATENEPYWTNTPDAPRNGAQINTGLNGLVINFATGEEFIDQDRDRILIRLVKDYQ
ncbi:putative Fimh-like protein [Vibrio sinaloensis DSM 21326]|uniref:Putative Fimh-like protein n=1 Tax=Vibrio sinaloensis DSM 21326 TaxID=945550 RepID=E8M6X8_PHOS4|nr:DUF1566 domain-containing protein [Vibrio sinaloensis]EGA70177.1 putative Fimh-like protein [Vibrio sinaloensis DSM 21326]